MDITVTGTIDHQKQIPTHIAVGLDVLGHRLSYRRNTVLVHAETFALVVFAGRGGTGLADAYRVGDFLKVKEGTETKASEVKVVRIDRFGITVEYKEEIRDIPMQ